MTRTIELIKHNWDSLQHKGDDLHHEYFEISPRCLSNKFLVLCDLLSPMRKRRQVQRATVTNGDKFLTKKPYCWSPRTHRRQRIPRCRLKKANSETLPSRGDAATEVSTSKFDESSVISNSSSPSSSTSDDNSLSTSLRLWPVDLITPPIEGGNELYQNMNEDNITTHRMLSTILVQHCLESFLSRQREYLLEVGICPVLEKGECGEQMLLSDSPPSLSNSFETVTNELYFEEYLINTELSETHLVNMEICPSKILLRGEGGIALKLNHVDVKRIELLHYEEYIAEKHRVSLAGHNNNKVNAIRKLKKNMMHKYRMYHARFLHWSKYRASAEYLDIEENRRVTGRYSVRISTASGNMFFIYFQKSHQRMFYLLLLRIFHSSSSISETTTPIEIVNTVIGSYKNSPLISEISDDSSSALTEKFNLKAIVTACEDYRKVTTNFLREPPRYIYK